METESKLHNIPDTWVWTTISEVGIIVSGGTPSTSNPMFWGDEFPWITPADLSEYKNKYISKGRRNITKLGLDYSSATLLPEGSLLFSSRAPIGYVVINQRQLATNQGFKSIIPVESTNIDYLFYYLLSAKREALKRASGTTFLELSSKAFGQLPVPIPPFDEQTRIAQKLNEIFEDLEDAENVLKKVKKQIEVFKYAILKSAFDGNLTKNWRLQNPSNSSLQFVKDLKTNKKEKYLSRLTNWKINPTDNKKPNKIIPIKIENKDDLRRIPLTWAWEPIGNICYIVRGGSPRPAGDSRYFGGTIPWITVAEITKDESVYLSSVSSYLTEFGKSQSRFIEKGNLLLSNSGATLGVPKITMVDGCINDGSVALLDVYDDQTRLFLYWFLRSKTHELRKFSQGAGQPNLNTTIVKNIAVPIPPYNELVSIIQEIEYRVILAEKLSETVENTIARMIAFRSSILKQAFEGKLVKQDLNDEPAQILLERITTEKSIYILAQKEIAKNKPVKEKLMEEKKTLMEILESIKAPISAKELWLQSKYKDDIEAFYFELREIQNQITEIKKDTESLITLRNEN